MPDHLQESGLSAGLVQKDPTSSQDVLTTPQDPVTVINSEPEQEEEIDVTGVDIEEIKITEIEVMEVN